MQLNWTFLRLHDITSGKDIYSETPLILIHEDQPNLFELDGFPITGIEFNY